MPTPHKHAELIKAWADGATIQVLTDDTGPSGETGNSWKTTAYPGWFTTYQYRIKPEPQVLECFVDMDQCHVTFRAWNSKYKRCTITIHPDE